MKMITAIWQALAVIAAINLALASITGARSQQTTFRDSGGRTTGTASTDSGGQTTFRDAGGRTTGTAATDSGGTTTFRNSSGRTIGTASGGRR